MTQQDGPIDFSARRQEFLRKRAEERGETISAPPPEPEQPQWDSSLLLPDLHDGGQEGEDNAELDRIIGGIDAITAYNKWIHKSHAVGGKKDGNMISCPNPEHPDKDPSAWINTEDNTWFCGGCQEGGDVYDLAAIHFGYPRPGYKDGQLFHKLRQEMAESFGWRFKKVSGGEIIYRDEPSSPPPVSQPPAVQQSAAVSEVPPPGDPGLKVAPTPAPETDDETPDNVSHMWADAENGEDEIVVFPTINWRVIIPKDSFLYEYMTACSNDDSPEEYHFWHGLLALGSVCGRKVTLDDHRPVYANLLVCLLGATGTGKSRSRGWLDTVLKTASPYHEDGTSTSGTKLIPVPGSGEYLVSSFSYEGKDPGNGKSSLGYQPVNGIVDFDEMSALLARAKREGSTLKSTIMALADARDEVNVGSLTRGEYHASQPFCSITASTQPKAIRTLVNRTDTGSGFLNRWIFAGGKSKETEVLGGSHSTTTVDLTKAIELLRNVRGWGAMERKITLEQDAYDTYVKYFRDVIEPAKLRDETDLLKRIDLISKKLMLLLTINRRAMTVDRQTVMAVIDIMEYVVECFGILNSNIGLTVMQDVMNDIQRVVKNHVTKTGRGASARDIARYTHRKNYTLEQIKKALDVMTALDMIELEPKKSGTQMGRPTARYLVVGE